MYIVCGMWYRMWCVVCYTYSVCTCGGGVMCEHNVSIWYMACMACSVLACVLAVGRMIGVYSGEYNCDT